MLCEAVDLRSARKVLDVATGHGNAALAAARRFCEVSAIDYVPTMLEDGRKRAAAEGLTVDFQVGDAEEIPFPDASLTMCSLHSGRISPPTRRRQPASYLGCASPEARSGWPTLHLTASQDGSAKLQPSICLLHLLA
jgi:SAM-dependent methyltransferase